MSVPQVVVILIFDQHHNPEQPGKARSAPYLATAPQALLQLLAQGFDSTTAPWSTYLLHRSVVKMVAMFHEELHLPFDQFLALRRSSRLVLEKLLQLTHDIIFSALAQTSQQGLDPSP